MGKYILVYILFFLGVSEVFAETNKATDTSLRLIEKAEKDLYSNPSQAAYWASQARVMSTERSVQSKALYIYAVAEKLLGNFESSITALYEADLALMIRLYSVSLLPVLLRRCRMPVLQYPSYANVMLMKAEALNELVTLLTSKRTNS